MRRWLEALLGSSRAIASGSTRLDAAEVIERLDSKAQPCVKVVHAETVQTSKLGGLPAVPPRFDWPTWNGAPLQFLCQLDLHEVQKVLPAEWLPEHGLLAFFYDAGQSTWGFDPNDRGSWRVEHFPPDRGAVPATPPQGAESVRLLPEVFVQFERGLSLPDPERVGLRWSEVPDEAWDYLEEQETDGSPAHRIGGYPSAIQNDGMELECQLASNGLYVGGPDGYASDEAKALAAGSAQWRLLLQLDSDDRAGVMWGDVGRLYFWIRETDAVRGDFSGVWMVLQCH